jgi:DedD protein
MASSQDTEITLGTGKLLFLFFGLVAVCALFFAMGYSLGRKAEPVVTTASAAVSQPTAANTSKGSSGSNPNPPMSFYKSVEQKGSTSDLTPPADSKADQQNSSAKSDTSTPASNGVDPSTTIPTSGYFVQVAAVSKQEDAGSLVDALKKKDYAAFVASTSAADKLFRVQVGPFSDIKDAESVRTKLVSDGYSPILKK